MRCAAYGGLAYEKPQSGLRPFTTGTSVRFFSGTFCPPLKPLRGFFIAAGKTSYTTSTLCAICPNFMVAVASVPSKKSMLMKIYFLI
jgi:hypothetical protein